MVYELKNKTLHVGEFYSHRKLGSGWCNEKAYTSYLLRLYLAGIQTITKEGYNGNLYHTSQLHGPGD